MEKFKREYSLSPIEFVKYQLNQSINFPEPVLNETDITILAYVYAYGGGAKKQILKDRILTSPNSFVNYISKLKNMNYILRVDEKVNPRNPRPPQLNPNLIILKESYIQINIIKLDPSNAEVFHPYYQKEPGS